APNWTAITNASCVRAARPHARATGGIRIAIWDQRRYCRRIAGSSTAATRRPASGSTMSKTRSGFIAATPFSIARRFARRISIQPKQSRRSKKTWSNARCKDVIDHVGYAVSDYGRAKAAYAKALAPLGYTLIMEVKAKDTRSGYPAAGFGIGGKPDFWIGGEGKLEKPLHVAITAKDRSSVDAFYQAALA